MISNPKYGWCNFDVEEFHGTPSYITEVPLDLIQCFLNYYRNGSASCFFDEEGTTFTFVISDMDAYVIINDEVSRLVRFNSSVNDLAQELITDIESNFDNWVVEFTLDDDSNILEQKKRELARNLAMLKLQLDNSKFDTMIINHSDEPHISTKQSIFLAGPTMRGATFEESWRKEACDYLKLSGFKGVVYVPEHKNCNNPIDLVNQFIWEQSGLDAAGVILFYLNRRFPENPGLTTNVEFGRYIIEKPHDIVLCSPKGYDKNGYLERLYKEKKPESEIFTDLHLALDQAIKML